MALKSENSPFVDRKVEDTELMNGYLRLKNDSSKSVSISDIMKQNDISEIVETYQAMPSKERANYTTLGHGIQFAEVKVDEDLGIIKVIKVIEATACGRVINPLTAHSQEMGGMIWGIGMALHENTEIDHRYGRMMTTKFADYHIPSNADVGYINTEFIEEKDEIVLRMIFNQTFHHFVGVPTKTFHFVGKQKSCIDSNAHGIKLVKLENWAITQEWDLRANAFKFNC